MNYVYDDGGRKAAGYVGTASDCVVRAIAIATQQPYQKIYDELNELCSKEYRTKGRTTRSSSRNGIYKATRKKFMKKLGWKWVPTMGIGTGCKVHLKASELPAGRLIVSVSKHLVAVIDGVIHDSHDCSRDETRCVYGYYMEVEK